MRVLLVEDHHRLRASIAQGLTEDGIAVEVAGSIAAARDRLRTPDFDAIVLDRGLPDGDGLVLVPALRGAHQWLPILVLTARDAVEDRVEALEAGADDYVVKPFAFAELLARLRAMTRRAAAPRWAALAFAGVTLDDELGVRFGTARVVLSPREHALLSYLMRRRDEVVSRADIFRDVFGYLADPGTNLIDVHLAHVRRKLEHAPVRIETIRGAGFRIGPRT